MKWAAYSLLLLLCTVLETTPGLFQLGMAKPLFILPLCMNVAICEGEFAGALFAAAGGLLWDYAAGRVVGMLTLALMVLCFFVSVLVQLYLRPSAINLLLLQGLAALLVLSADHLFFYIMPGYADALGRWMQHALPSAVMTVLAVVPLFRLVRRISAVFSSGGSAV